MSAPSIVVAAGITVGDHPTFKFLGLTFNRDTLVSTGVAGLLVLVLGLLVARNITSGVPNKLQLFFETLIDWVNKQVEESMGITVAPFVVPLAVTLFFFILSATGSKSSRAGKPREPTGANGRHQLDLCLGVAVIVLHITSVRRRGARRIHQALLPAVQGLRRHQRH